jgi:hypothetical protein
MKVISLAKGSLRVRVKSAADCFDPGSIFLGIRLRKNATVSATWNEFSWQDLCHDGQLLSRLLLETTALKPATHGLQYLTYLG